MIGAVPPTLVHAAPAYPGGHGITLWMPNSEQHTLNVEDSSDKVSFSSPTTFESRKSRLRRNCMMFPARWQALNLKTPSPKHQTNPNPKTQTAPNTNHKIPYMSALQTQTLKPPPKKKSPKPSSTPNPTLTPLKKPKPQDLINPKPKPTLKPLNNPKTYAAKKPKP